MKMTKTETDEKRTALCRVLIQAARLKAKAESIKKDLADDFSRNKKAYRSGIKTPAGVLYRKPRFEVTAKEPVAIED